MKPNSPALQSLITALRSQKGRIPYKRKPLGIDTTSFWLGFVIATAIGMILIILTAHQHLAP